MGADLVPMYAFGDTELFEHSTLGLGLRKWIVRKFHVRAACKSRLAARRAALEATSPLDARRGYNRHSGRDKLRRHAPEVQVPGAAALAQNA